MFRNSYQELLNTPEWGAKRVEILQRDSYTCQRCGTGKDTQIRTIQTKFKNKDTISFAPYPRATKDSRKIKLKFASNHEGFPFKTNLSIAELNKNQNLILIVQYVKKDFLTYPFVATLGDVNFDPEVHQAIDNDIMITQWRKHTMRSPDLDIDLEGICILDEKDYSDVAYLKNYIVMEVHHKCYRSNIDIWNDRNNEYVTLCNICHDIVHENQDIPF